MDQISEGGRSIHEIDKIRKRLEAEKLELQAAFEAESKGKAEAMRMKKKLEADVAELEMSLEHANSTNLETQKSIKKYQTQIRDCQAKLEDEQRSKEVAREQLLVADRKAHAMTNALEEARSLLEQADKQRRNAETELSDVNESLSEATVQNQSIAAAKRKMESEMTTLHADFDEMSSEAQLSEGKAAKAMVDAARLADELRSEQDNAMMTEKQRKVLEAQWKEMQNRLDEAETNALKGGKKAITKMETRIRELESEMDAEGRRSGDAHKNLRKSERRIKELSFQQDEDRKNHERMQALVDQLQGEIKSYKKQIEEAEEIAALNLAKFRQVQSNLAASGERADLNEQALAKMKASSRASSLAPM